MLQRVRLARLAPAVTDRAMSGIYVDHRSFALRLFNTLNDTQER